MKINMAVSVFLLTVCFLGAVYGQPTIEPTLIMGRLDENVTITCIVEPSEPGSTQLLTSNSQQLMHNTRVVGADRVVYTYGPLTIEDNGREVICRYGNREAMGSIFVLIPPMYSLNEPMRNVRENTRDYTITLNLTASPLPTNEETTWTFNGGALGTGVTVTYNSITFDSVVRAHTGTYSVSANTSAGMSNSVDITVNVLYPPQFTAGFGLGVSCSTMSSPYQCAIREGGSGTFNCAVIGNPTPTLVITENSDNIVANEATGVITLTSAALADSSTSIVCSATNSVESSQRSFVLYVGTPPTQPSNVAADFSDSATIEFSWAYADEGNLIPLSEFVYVIDLGRVNTTILQGTVEPEMRTLNISISSNGLELNTTYGFTIFARNVLQDGNPAGTEFTTPTMLPTEMPTGSALHITSCLLSVLLMVVLTFLLRL